MLERYIHITGQAPPTSTESGDADSVLLEPLCKHSLQSSYDCLVL